MITHDLLHPRRLLTMRSHLTVDRLLQLLVIYNIAHDIYMTHNAIHNTPLLSLKHIVHFSRLPTFVSRLILSNEHIITYAI